MQLIPETQARFSVTRPFDAQQNIRGAKDSPEVAGEAVWSDWVRISAAFNAGEQAVLCHGGVPPYQETQGMCVRVLYYRGRILTTCRRPTALRPGCPSSSRLSTVPACGARLCRPSPIGLVNRRFLEPG